ncbi:hypothetical protein NQ317_006890 [Molorchus minor]|uniref:Uncharacterized protein n=1 Tax=Molorchus minor TaxID=1323400 RepID=A0ABQ9JLP2_9CUCU|nr:hypothetical protein NQ317_006890 [Molorchus minor]
MPILTSPALELLDFFFRVCNPSSEIFNVIRSPSSEKANGHYTPRRASQHVDSFNRLFGNTEIKKTPPRRASLTNQDVTNRNPVTGNGVTSYDCKTNRNSPRIHIERNPVTGETYTIVSPVTTPTKPVQNGFTPEESNLHPHPKWKHYSTDKRNFYPQWQRLNYERNNFYHQETKNHILNFLFVNTKLFSRNYT